MRYFAFALLLGVSLGAYWFAAVQVRGVQNTMNDDRDYTSKRTLELKDEIGNTKHVFMDWLTDSDERQTRLSTRLDDLSKRQDNSLFDLDKQVRDHGSLTLRIKKLEERAAAAAPTTVGPIAFHSVPASEDVNIKDELVGLESRVAGARESADRQLKYDLQVVEEHLASRLTQGEIVFFGVVVLMLSAIGFLVYQLERMRRASIEVSRLCETTKKEFEAYRLQHAKDPELRGLI